MANIYSKLGKSPVRTILLLQHLVVLAAAAIVAIAMIAGATLLLLVEGVHHGVDFASRAHVLATTGLVAILIFVGLLCFSYMGRLLVEDKGSGLTVDRTAVLLGGGSRLEISKPLGFAIGAIFSFVLAASLLSLVNRDTQPPIPAVNQQNDAKTGPEGGS